MRTMVLCLSILAVLTVAGFNTVSASDDLKSTAVVKLQNAVVKALPVESGMIRIAILDFEGDDGTLRNAISSAVSAKTSYRIIERVDLDKILQEQGLQLKDIIDEKTRVEHGKIKGVQGLLIGSVQGMKRGFMSYSIDLHLKLDDVEKGEIVFSRNFNISVVSPYRKWLYVGATVIILVVVLVRLRGRRQRGSISTEVKRDIRARIDLAREIDKSVANLAAARSKLNALGEKDKAVMVSNVEGDLLNLKQTVETAPQGSAYMDNTGEYKEVREFDERILTFFEALTESVERIHGLAISRGADNIEGEIDGLKKNILAVRNAYRDRGF